jgi:hypothetical protein
MNKVFIGGSRRISKLNHEVKKRMDNIIKQGYTVLVGDANGVDKAVQNYLFQNNYRDVIVFCVADGCRNNVGSWPVENVVSISNNKDFNYYSQKDLEMAKHADYGFMIWDAKSKGTLRNAITLLEANKTTLLYFSPEKKFYTLSRLSELKNILSKCDKRFFEIFEKKLNLSEVFTQSHTKEVISVADGGNRSYQHTLDNVLLNIYKSPSLDHSGSDSPITNEN